MPTRILETLPAQTRTETQRCIPVPWDGVTKGQCQAKHSEVRKDKEQIPSQAGDGKNNTGWLETTGNSPKNQPSKKQEVQCKDSLQPLLFLFSLQQNRILPVFLWFSCVLLKFEHFRHLELQALGSSGPFLLSPQTQCVPNTGAGLGYSHCLPWTRPRGFSSQASPSAGNDPSFLPPS